MHREAGEFRSIATLMLQRIIALALVCLIGMGGLQLWLERQQQEKLFFQTMALMVETSSQAMAHAIWDIDRDVLSFQIRRLTELEAVGLVRVHIRSTGEILTSGRAGGARMCRPTRR